MMRQNHSQLHSQKQSYKDLRYIIKPKEVYDDSNFNTDEYEDEFSESYIENISNYEINYETFRYQGYSLKDAGTIIKTDAGYRFLFKNPKFEELDQTVKDYFFNFEEITPNKLKGILKKRKKNEKNKLSLYIPGGNPSNYFIRLPNGDKLHFTWLFRSSGKDSEIISRYCFRILMKNLKDDDLKTIEIIKYLSDKEKFERAVKTYCLKDCQKNLSDVYNKEFFVELIKSVKKEAQNWKKNQKK